MQTPHPDIAAELERLLHASPKATIHLVLSAWIAVRQVDIAARRFGIARTYPQWVLSALSIASQHQTASREPALTAPAPTFEKGRCYLAAVPTYTPRGKTRD